MSPSELAAAVATFKKYESDIKSIAHALATVERPDHLPSELELQNILKPVDAADINARVQRARKLYVFLYEHMLRSGNRTIPNQASTVASDTDLLAFLHVLHELPTELGVSKLSLHAAGTTSFIFKAESSTKGICALKLVQAPYMTVQAVRQATKEYEARYGVHTKFSPKIFQSGDTWLLMEFVEGLPLYEFLEKLRADRKTFMSEAYFDTVSSIFEHLTTALAYYERQSPPIAHGDLTPFNIIVELKSGEQSLQPIGVKLLDFGANYVLQQKIYSRHALLEAFAQVELFVAPEVLRGAEPSLRSDLYSLGIIGVDLLSGEALRYPLIGQRLRAIWEHPASAGLAQVIEDLIDENPEKRLLLLRPAHNETYSTLNGIVKEKVALYKELVKRSADDISFTKQVWRKLKPNVWGSVWNIYKLLRSKDRVYTNIGKGLFLSALINAFFQAVIVYNFISYTYLDAKLAWFPQHFSSLDSLLSPLIRWVPPNFVPGDFWGNLPGRCVALTFGLIACRYYGNIFATLAVSNTSAVPGNLVRTTNFVLRANCVSYFVPIMITLVWSPHWWPWCVVAGTAFTVLNNYLCLKVARIGNVCAREHFSTAQFYDDTYLGYFAQWYPLMGMYSIGIGVLGVFLALGWAVDDWIYASTVSLINHLKIYQNNCGREAPMIQGTLSRLFFASRRCAAFKSP